MHDKRRVILDTNVFLSAILFGKTPGEIIELWQEEIFDLAISPETLAELIGKLKFKFGLPQDLIDEWHDLISKQSIRVMPEYKAKACRDPEDDKFLDVAFAARADYLVTGDHDLLTLKDYFNVKILRPREFLDILRK